MVANAFFFIHRRQWSIQSCHLIKIVTLLLQVCLLSLSSFSTGTTSTRLSCWFCLYLGTTPGTRKKSRKPWLFPDQSWSKWSEQPELGALCSLLNRRRWKLTWDEWGYFKKVLLITVFSYHSIRVIAISLVNIVQKYGCPWKYQPELSLTSTLFANITSSWCFIYPIVTVLLFYLDNNHLNCADSGGRGWDQKWL